MKSGMHEHIRRKLSKGLGKRGGENRESFYRKNYTFETLAGGKLGKNAR